MASILERMLSEDAGREWLRRRGYIAPETAPTESMTSPGTNLPETPPPPSDEPQQPASQQPPDQMQQVEAKDESQDTAPAPGVGTDVPQAGMTESELAPYNPTTPPPAVQATPRDVQPQAEAPSFNETAARLALEQARRSDLKNRAYWELGEGLKQAMGTIAGRPYSPRAFAGDEAPILAESQQSQRQAALQAYQRAQAAKAEARQGRIDDETAMLHEAQRIKDLAEADAKMRGTPGESEYQKALVELRKKDQALREEEINRKKKEAEDALKRKGAGAAAAAEGLKIPFPGGEFVPTPGRSIPKEQTAKARDHASQLGGAVSQMDELQGAMQEFAHNPSVTAKSNLNSRVRMTAQAISQAIGSGAMNNEEAAAYSGILGVSLTTPGALEAFVDRLSGEDKSAQEDFVSKLKSARESLVANARGRLKAYNYEFSPSSAPPTVHMDPVSRQGMVKVRSKKTGAEKLLDPQSAEKYRGSPDFEVGQ